MNPIETRLDALWSKAVKVKHHGKCVICYQTASASHHLIGRRHKSVRWDIDNGVALCVNCHRLVHDGKIKLDIPEEVRILSRQVAKFSGDELLGIAAELREAIKQKETVCT